MACTLIRYSPVRQEVKSWCANPASDNNSRITFKSVKNIASIFDAQAGNKISLSAGMFFRDVVREENMTVSIGGKHTSIDYGQVLKEVQSYIHQHIGSDPLWRQQEMKTYLSAEMNRTIDQVCTKLSRAINSQQKQNIFSAMSRYGIALDAVCAQSTIKQVLNTKILQKDDYLASKINQLSHADDKINNEVKNVVVDKFSSKIFEEYFSFSEAAVTDLKYRVSDLAIDSILDNENVPQEDREIIKDMALLEMYPNIF
ncbi:hypothetical protein HZV92_001806 [Salmonella enterica]|nr:hypothetical protein [Salmonella enterica]EFQ6618145.1 hypothetical protein [Salmonella enterica]